MADELQPASPAAADAPMDTVPPSEEPAAPPAGRKRPKLDLTAALGGAPAGGPGSGKERKRTGMFGVLLGTLNKAKIEDKERNASDAAKKRALTEQRLQAKLRKETETARRADEAKADKVAAVRKEEDLALRQTLHKLRRARLPALANFLCTADVVPALDDSSEPPASDPAALPRRAHPPPLFYLPAVLTPAQSAFLARKKAAVTDAAEKEWATFVEERRTTMLEIGEHRKRFAEETERHRSMVQAQRDAAAATAVASEPASAAPPADAKLPPVDGEAAMEVEPPVVEKETPAEPAKEKETPEDAMQADDDDAVEY